MKIFKALVMEISRIGEKDGVQPLTSGRVRGKIELRESETTARGANHKFIQKTAEPWITTIIPT